MMHAHNKELIQSRFGAKSDCPCAPRAVQVHTNQKNMEGYDYCFLGGLTLVSSLMKTIILPLNGGSQTVKKPYKVFLCTHT